MTLALNRTNITRFYTRFCYCNELLSRQMNFSNSCEYDSYFEHCKNSDKNQIPLGCFTLRARFLTSGYPF